MYIIKHVIFFVLLVSLISCVSNGSYYYVDDLNRDKSNFYEKKIVLTGVVDINNSILYVCSEVESKQCIPIEAPKKIYEDLKRLERNKVHLKGKYVDHEFADDGTNFLPSRFIVTNYSKK